MFYFCGWEGGIGAVATGYIKEKLCKPRYDLDNFRIREYGRRDMWLNWHRIFENVEKKQTIS